MVQRSMKRVVGGSAIQLCGGGQSVLSQVSAAAAGRGGQVTHTNRPTHRWYTLHRHRFWTPTASSQKSDTKPNNSTRLVLPGNSRGCVNHGPRLILLVNEPGLTRCKVAHGGLWRCQVL